MRSGKRAGATFACHPHLIEPQRPQDANKRSLFDVQNTGARAACVSPAVSCQPWYRGAEASIETHATTAPHVTSW